jgi:hypothetical protein
MTESFCLALADPLAKWSALPVPTRAGAANCKGRVEVSILCRVDESKGRLEVKVVGWLMVETPRPPVSGRRPL